MDGDIEIEKLTDELGFYETYTCQISYSEFQTKNIFTSYQDHYRINLNNYSEVPCYGKLTGVDRLGDTFYISIGLNPMITLIIQSIFLSLLILLKRKNSYLLIEENLKYIVALVASSALITFGFYSQKRYYQKNFVDLNFKFFETYQIIFIFVLFASYILVYSFNSRSNNLVNYFPFLFLFIGIPYGLNLYIYFLVFVFFGIYKTLFSYKTLNKLLLYSILVFVWITSVNNWFGIYFKGNSFYLRPDKMVGLSSTVYSYNSVIYWSYLIFFCVTGITFFLDRVKEHINYLTIKYSFYYVSVLVALLSCLNVEIQIFNSFSQIYFGQNKASTRDFPQEMFSNWRGYFPSAENMGEFYCLTILIFMLLKYFKKVETNKWEYVPLSISFIFLLLSFNRAAIILTIVFSLVIYLKTNKQYLNRSFISFFIIGFIFIFIILYLNDQIFAYSYTSDKLFIEAKNSIVFEQSSKAILFLEKNLDNSLFLKFIFGILSTTSFYLNRSYLWGLFFARYNPSTKEFLFGTGPFNLSNLYNEIQVSETSSFLWPHSSMLQLLFYFGIIGLLFLTFLVSIKIYQSIRINKLHIGRYIFIFLIINFVKSDSIMYFPSLFTTIFFYNSLKFLDFKINK